MRGHLESSGQYDRGVVLCALEGSGLHEELVVLHCQMGDHLAALRVLCLALRDIAGAQAYATAFLPPQEYRTLLHVVLHPGGGREPLYEDATYLVTTLGEYLDPMDVLQTLPPSMPLAAAAGIVAPIMRDRTHRRRQGAVAKSLLRAQLMRARGEKCDAESARVVVDDERACPGCHLRIGGKVFVALNHPAAKHSQNGAGQVAAADAWGGWPGAGARVSSRAAGGGALDGADRSQHAHHGNNGGERDIQVFCYSCYRRMAGKGAGLRETMGDQS